MLLRWADLPYVAKVHYLNKESIMIKIIPMKYDESLIPFNGDCWVNATVAAKYFDKRALDWLGDWIQTKEYAKKLVRSLIY